MCFNCFKFIYIVFWIWIWIFVFRNFICISCCGEKYIFIVVWNFVWKKNVEFIMIWFNYYKKEIYNSFLVFVKIFFVFLKINFGKSNGVGFVILLCFVMWMDLNIWIFKLEMFWKRINFKCLNFDIFCFWKYVNIWYLLKNMCIFVVLLFLL